MRKKTSLFCVLTLLFICSSASIAAGASLVDWPSIFNTDGSINDLNGGIDAVFLPDNISAGIATDMTRLDAESGAVVNGPVAVNHDLGNGYVYVTRDGLGKLIIHAAVDRLVAGTNTYVDFEFNQRVVGVTAGAPWPIQGIHAVNDVKYRFNFLENGLESVQFGGWDGTRYVLRTMSVPAEEGCYVVASAIGYCNGTPLAGLPPANKQVWDSTFKVVQVPDASDFIELRINVSDLLGSDAEYSSIVISTPEDVVLGSFRKMGYWAGLDSALASGK